MRTQIPISLSGIVAAVMILSCKSNSSGPTGPSQIRVEVDTTIVPYDSLRGVGCSGFYDKILVWQGFFNPNWGDSVLSMLLDSNFTVVDFWYPEGAGICLDPLPHEREIVKLLEPDTTIFRLGYTAMPAGYTDFCVPYWRHYKVRRLSGVAKK
jgi:hypothetical protein